MPGLFARLFLLSDLYYFAPEMSRFKPTLPSRVGKSQNALSSVSLGMFLRGLFPSLHLFAGGREKKSKSRENRLVIAPRIKAS